MTIQSLPALDPIPTNIEDHLQRLLRAPAHPATGEWLLELIKNSGHLSTADDMRWRVFCITWLACEYNTDQAWPYLMWLNMNEPSISAHLSEILIEAIDQLEAHVPVANWLANPRDERLAAFFQDFQVIPAQRKVAPLISRLMRHPVRPEIGVWLEAFCNGTSHNSSNTMRPWRLLAAAWYAAAFNPQEGLNHLKLLANGSASLSSEDNQQLMDAAGQANALASMIQLVAGCPNPAVKNMLKDFGHPNLAIVAQAALDSDPDYRQLENLAGQASFDAETFQRNLACLEQADMVPKTTTILNLACGLLAPQTLLFSSLGYNTVGVDLHIPPGFLPISGLKQWFKRRQHASAWKQAAAAYYEALARQVEMKLKWNRAKIKLADLTRLEADDNSFEAVICANYLQHAPNVAGLLAEAARVLKPGGVFVADIWPFAGLNGAFQTDSNLAWGHLRGDEPLTAAPLNRWREAQFKKAIETYFVIDRWLPEPDPEAQARLTPELAAELVDYSQEELTCKQIVVIARGK